MVVEQPRQVEIKRVDKRSLWAYCVKHLEWLRSKGLAMSSESRYTIALRHFCAWMGTKEVSSNNIATYSVELSESGASPATLNLHCAVLSGLFRWMHKKGITSENLMNKADMVRKKPAKVTKLCSASDYEKLKSLSIGTPYYGVIVALYNTGMRISDCAALKWANIDLERQVIKIEPIKTARLHHEAIIPLVSGNDLTEFLIQQYAMRAELPESKQSKYVFPGTFGDSMQSTKFGVFLRKVGYTKGAHSFRRAFITSLLSAGVDSMIAMQVVGIRDHKTLSHYVAPSESVLRGAINKGLEFAKGPQ